jgi:hypothetical protein
MHIGLHYDDMGRTYSTRERGATNVNRHSAFIKTLRIYGNKEPHTGFS